MPKQVMCIYAPTGDGKTSLLGTFARGLHEATGKKTRIYTADGGPFLDRDLVEAGVVEIWNTSAATYPFERLREICSGAWPEDIADADSPLISAVEAVRYVAQCIQCKKVWHDSEKLPSLDPILCTVCKRPVPLKIRRKVNEENGIGKVGAIFYEGLTAFAEKLMDNMSLRSARGEKIGEDVAVKFRDGAENVAGSSRSSYGIAQRRLKAAVDLTQNLPVDYVAWSATKARATDDERRIPVFGPKIVGNAATDDVPRWFGPTLALVTVPLTGGLTERRLYLTKFFETWSKATADVECLANARIPPAQLYDVPPYLLFGPTQSAMLWDVIQWIEAKQAGKKPLALPSSMLPVQTKK